MCVIHIRNKIKTYKLQKDLNLDTIDANLKLGMPVDRRDYSTAYEILKFFKVIVSRFI